MLNKLRSLLDNENTYFFGFKNYIIAAIVLFYLVDSALLGLNRGVARRKAEQVAGATADQGIEIKVEDEDIGGNVTVEDEIDDQSPPADDELGKILQEAAFITREELEDTDVSVPSDGNAEDGASENGTDSSSGSELDNGSGDEDDKNYTAEEQSVIAAAATVSTAVQNADSKVFYQMLCADLQDLFGEDAVVNAFAIQDVSVASTQVISDPELVGDVYAQIKVRFNFADQSSEDYWIYLVKENSSWRLLGTEVAE